ncbi:hypothetical protein N7465_004547 [Penicillium sp. CMV-2018d]|nr:hypothetical protein N7465_004547 [Penicillium sp. CMV-2018d]
MKRLKDSGLSYTAVRFQVTKRHMLEPSSLDIQSRSGSCYMGRRLEKEDRTTYTLATDGDLFGFFRMTKEGQLIRIRYHVLMTVEGNERTRAVRNPVSEAVSLTLTEASLGEFESNSDIDVNGQRATITFLESI